MKNFRPMIRGAAALTITGGVLAATVGTAAASFPSTPWQPAPSTEQIGTLALFNSSGQQVTHGTNLNHLFDYALASSVGPTDGNKIANLVFANPTPGQDPGLWPTSADEASNYPNTDAGTPASVKNQPNPLVTLDSGGANLAAAKGGFTANTAASGYQNRYEVRAYTVDAGKYWTADILVTGTSWTEEFGSAVSSSTAVAATPNPQGQGGAVQLTATVTMADGSTPAGTVAFTSGATNLGSSSSFNGSGQASVSTSVLPQGHDTITATFTPSSAGAVTYTGSNGSSTEDISAPATNTTTTLTISGNTSTGTDATLQGTVAPAAAGGTVSFYDNNSGTAINSSPIAVTGGSYGPYTLTGGFSAGSHSVVAKFTSSAPGSFNSSQSAAVVFTTVPPSGTSCASEQPNPTSGCTDVQTITGTIPPGTLSISTPYTNANPLNVGTLGLSADGNFWTKTATFKCITVTDATAGGSAFSASALANPLSLVGGTGTGHGTGPTTINGENVGLTALGQSTGTCPDTTAPVNSYTKAVTPTDNTAATGVAPADTGHQGLGDGGATPQPHVVLTGAAGGEGTATYDGTLTLNAPTSTQDGQYKGTIVFTVTD